MSLNPLNVPLLIEIKPTFQKALLIFTPHLLVFALVVSFDVFNWLIKASLLVFIFISIAYYFRLHLIQKSKKSILSIQQDSVNNWFVAIYDEGHEAKLESVILLASSFVSKSLIVLNYRNDSGSQYSVIITRDSISSNEFRRLQVRLKLSNIKKS